MIEVRSLKFFSVYKNCFWLVLYYILLVDFRFSLKYWNICTLFNHKTPFYNFKMEYKCSFRWLLIKGSCFIHNGILQSFVWEISWIVFSLQTIKQRNVQPLLLRKSSKSLFKFLVIWNYNRSPLNALIYNPPLYLRWTREPLLADKKSLKRCFLLNPSLFS